MIILKYWSPHYQIAFSNWKEVYQFPQQEIMIKEIHQDCLCYRIRGSARRISYRQLKKGLQKKQHLIRERLLPF